MNAAGKLEYLLVDGYNIIFSWKELASDAESSLDCARVRLMDILSDFQGFTGYEIILAFDAHRVEKNVERSYQYGNITVVYTREAETADSYIERSAKKLAGRYGVTVATDDKLEQIIIISGGARRISAAALSRLVKDARKTIEIDYIKKRPAKNNMLVDNIDADTVKQLERMRRNGEKG
ncbi:MAG: NYN domain-containing protein [Clostridiales bacterium]|jgi:predicted RNA-binding protein with PIN domain|nr:NYN domain-containing protein [Clostridiales bacterium]